MVNDNILEVKGLRKLFPIKEGVLGKIKGYVYAVDGVSFKLKEGETLGLVGESGCGKTTVGRCILRLIEPTEGEIIFNGVNITDLSPSELRRYRREMQIVFQDPYASLNPRWTIKNIISEPLLIHGLAKRNELY
ncbi:MAG: ATP-binding cassette domain-containing protein, partial [Candidatus Bathyarchaeia archaeon]